MHAAFGAAVLVLALGVGVAGCGSGDTSSGDSQPAGSPVPASQAPRSTAPTTPSGNASAEGTCDPQQVPGHEGIDVRVTGLDCAAARAVILDAVGKGRAAYDSGGLSCTPTDAPQGRTDYACTGQDGARLTFRYGAG